MKLSFLIFALLLSNSTFARFSSMTAFWRAGKTSIAYSTTAQSIYSGNCSSVITIQTKNASGVVTNVSSNLTIKSLSLSGNTLTKNGGVLTVNGSIAGTGALFGGTVAP